MMKWVAIIVLLFLAVKISELTRDWPETPHSFKGNAQYTQFAEQQSDLCVNNHAYGHTYEPLPLEEFCDGFSSAITLNKAMKEHPRMYEEFLK